MKKMYIVKYSVGEYDDYHENELFVTSSKSVATKYTTKFNNILQTWKDYYKQFEENSYGISWLKDEYVEQYLDRWLALRNTNRCFWAEIEVR